MTLIIISNYSHLDNNEYNKINIFLQELLNNETSCIGYLVNNFNVLYDEIYILYDKYKLLIIDDNLNIIDYIYWIIKYEYNRLIDKLNDSLDNIVNDENYMKYLDIISYVIQLNNILYDMTIILDKEYCLKTRIGKQFDILKILTINNHYYIIKELLYHELISKYIVFKYFIKYNKIDNLHLLQESNISILYDSYIDFDYILFKYFYEDNIDNIYNKIYQVYNLVIIQKILNSNDNNLLKENIINILNYDINNDYYKFNKKYNYLNHISNNYICNYKNLSFISNKDYDEYNKDYDEYNKDCELCKKNLCESCYNCLNNECEYCNYLNYLNIYNVRIDYIDSCHVEYKLVIYILNKLPILLEYLLQNKLIDERYYLSNLVIPNIYNIKLLHKYNKLTNNSNFNFVLLSEDIELIYYYLDNNLIKMLNILQLYLNNNIYNIKILNDLLLENYYLKHVINNIYDIKLLTFIFDKCNIEIFNRIIILSKFDKLLDNIQYILKFNRLDIIRHLLDLIKTDKNNYNKIIDLSFKYNADIFIYITDNYKINIIKDHIIDLINKKLPNYPNIYYISRINNDIIFFEGFKQSRYKFIFKYAHKLNLLTNDIINNIILNNYNSEILIYLLYNNLININDDNLIKIFNTINNIINNNKNYVFINFVKKYKHLIDEQQYNNFNNIKTILNQYNIKKNKFIEDHKQILNEINIDQDSFNNIVFEYVISL